MKRIIGTTTFVVVRDSFFALLVALLGALSVAAPAVAQAVATDPSPACLSETAADARGRSEPSHSRFLVLDLSQPEGMSGIANRIFSFARDDADPVVHALHDALHAMQRSPIDSLDKARVAIDLLHKCANHLARRSTNRWISSKGDSVEIYLLRPAGRQAKIDIAEEARQTRLSSDLVTLVQLAQQMVFGIMEAGPKYSFTFSEYYLTKIRATLKVAGSLLPDKQNPNASSSLNTLLITGPREHFFLSANAAFTKIKQIKYDDKTRTLEPAATPSQFMVGLDYTYGDLFGDAKQSGLRSFLEGLYLGLAVEGSTSPFNQIALTVGFRHVPGLEKYVTFEAVSPYVGYLLVRNDRIIASSGSTAIESKYAKKEFVYGLSLNLSKALGWVGK